MTPKEHFKGVQVLQAAFVVGLLLLLGVSVYLNYSELGPLLEDESVTGILKILSIALPVPAVVGGILVFNKITGNINDQDSLDSKLLAFRNANLVRLACIEGAALLGITSYLVTGNQVSMISGVLLIAVMGFLKPSKAELKKALKLTPTQATEIEQI